MERDTLTETGRQMARLPVDPRIARMIIESGRQGCAREILVIAAALSIQDPRERPTDNQQAADTAHRRFAQPESDFVAFVALWDYLAEKQRELTGSAFRRLCRAEFLNYLRVREWQDLHGQLSSLARELGIKIQNLRLPNGPWFTPRCCRLLSHVGMKVVLTANRPGGPAPETTGPRANAGRRPLPEYLGARGAKFAVFPGSGLAKKPPDWIVAAELVETSRLWGRTVAAIEPEWVEPIAAHLVKRSYSEPRWSRSLGAAVATEKVTLYGIPIIADRQLLLAKIDPVWRGSCSSGTPSSRASGRPGTTSSATTPPSSSRRPSSSSAPAAAAWWRARTPCSSSTTPASRPTQPPPGTSTPGGRRPATRPRTCSRSRSTTCCPMRRPTSTPTPTPRCGRRPRPAWPIRAGGPAGLTVSYTFEPGHDADGVTIDIPLKTLNQASPEEFSWQIPGLRLELVTELIRSLPKTLRRELVPAPDLAREILAGLDGAVPTADIRDTLSRELLRLRGVRVPADAFDLEKLPPHLRITFRVMDGEKVVAAGKDLGRAQAPAPPQGPRHPVRPRHRAHPHRRHQLGLRAAAEGLHRRRGQGLPGPRRRRGGGRRPAVRDRRRGAAGDAGRDPAARPADREVARQRGRQAAQHPPEARAERQPARLGRRPVRRLRQLRDRRADQRSGRSGLGRGRVRPADRATSGPGCTPPPTRSSPGPRRSCGPPMTPGSASRDSAARSSRPPPPTSAASSTASSTPAS